jgi:hypothetical protein
LCRGPVAVGFDYDTGVARAAIIAAVVALPGAAAAQPTVADDAWSYRSGGELAIDGGLVVGFPVALPTGLSRGVGAGISWGRCLALGARATWGTATESTMAWTVTHRDLRLRATGALQRPVGRGLIGLRVAVGGTLVHETRLRNQGGRAGLMGSELETSAVALLPATDLEAVVAVHVAGAWSLAMSGGPSIALRDGSPRASWTAQLGVSWTR